MDERLKKLMNRTNAVLEPWKLMLADPNTSRGLWHLYYYDSATKYCIPVIQQRDPDRDEPTCMSDLVQGFDPETPAAEILEWARANGVLND